MRPKHKRLFFILTTVLSISVGIYILLSTFQRNIVFFVTPSDALIIDDKSKTIRIGGVVRPNSLSKDDITYSFDLMDEKSIISVTYKGLLPDLFKEESTVVIQGKFNGTAFMATEVLAKHDENYKPLELKKDT